MRAIHAGLLLLSLVLMENRALIGQSATDVTEVHQVGHGVSAPKIIYQPEAEFSDLARKKKVTGACSLSLIVDTDGHVGNVRVVRSIAEGLPEKLRAAAVSLDGKAIEAARQYRFEPAMLDGKAVRVMLTIEISFQTF